MREIICIHIGQGGIQLGNACWELFCLEHGISPEGTLQSPKETANDAYQVFFEENKLGKHIPRNIYIDLDEDIINEARTGKYRKLFHPDQLISGKGGASNNYARGYSYMKYVDISLNKIRQMADNSDNLEGFIIFNSISGGTGSGLGTLLLEEISTTYESKKKLGFQIFGSPHTSTSSTESYNSMLNLHSILEHMDASIIIDNNAVYDMCRNTLELTSYIYMNSIIAQSIASQTASFRYSGTLLVNANMSEFLDNLVHYPRIKFLLSSYSPILSINKCIHESMSAFDITDWAFQPTSMMAKCNPAWGKYLAVCLMYRGDVAHRDINAAIYPELCTEEASSSHLAAPPEDLRVKLISNPQYMFLGVHFLTTECLWV